MATYEELGDSTLTKLESLTNNEVLFVLTHCLYNLLKKKNSDITDDEKKCIDQAVAEMAICFVQLTNMYNVSADELVGKVKEFIKHHEHSIDKCFSRTTEGI